MLFLFTRSSRPLILFLPQVGYVSWDLAVRTLSVRASAPWAKQKEAGADLRVSPIAFIYSTQHGT